MDGFPKKILLLLVECLIYDWWKSYLLIMSYLELKNITKKYDDLVAVDQLDFSVEKNEFAVLFGSSAAGKTTTLRCIAGLEKTESGEVWFNNNNFTDAPIQGAKRMAMVFQTFALYPHLTTKDNLAYPLIKKKIDKSEIAKRISETAEMLRITHALDRKPDTLSGGEQQRLAIGRALIQQPKLLLLDEPLANLDAKLRHDTRAELKKTSARFKYDNGLCNSRSIRSFNYGRQYHNNKRWNAHAKRYSRSIV